MIDIVKLKEEQRKLAEKVSIVDTRKSYEFIGGVAQLYVRKTVFVVIVVCDHEDFSVIEKQQVNVETLNPYKSGFQFYSDGLAIIEAYNKLKQKPDILFVSGNGILHPRRLGMASQLGIVLDVPTIGIAKRLMMGDVREGRIYDDKEALGYQLITKKHAKPLFISPGHMISLNSSSEIVRKSIRHPHKLPEPLHIAHRYVKQWRNAFMKKSD